LRVRDPAAIALGLALLLALARYPAGALAAGLASGALEGNAARGFLASLAAGMIYAILLTVMVVGKGPVAVAFEFYYAYVVDTVISSVGGLIGGWALRRRRRGRAGW
jgi:hypothetical protein